MPVYIVIQITLIDALPINMAIMLIHIRIIEK